MSNTKRTRRVFAIIITIIFDFFLRILSITLAELVKAYLEEMAQRIQQGQKEVY